jgi:hypothetical protein
MDENSLFQLSFVNDKCADQAGYLIIKRISMCKFCKTHKTKEHMRMKLPATMNKETFIKFMEDFNTGAKNLVKIGG